MKLRYIISFGVSLAFVFGCTTAPKEQTKVYENSSSQILEKPVDKQTVETNVLGNTENLIIVDSRPYFEYSMAHYQNAISLDWHEFTEKKEPLTGAVKKDLQFESRRLARLGIAKESSVMVVGTKGKFDAYKLAWIFRVLGVEKVQVKNFGEIQAPVSNNKEKALDAKPSWVADKSSSLNCEYKEFHAAVEEPLGAQGMDASILLDVRSLEEYQGKVLGGLKVKAPPIGAFFIAIDDFMLPKEQAQVVVEKKLKDMKIKKDAKIILFSVEGLRSSFATLQMLDWGYKNVCNYSGGLKEYMHRSGTEKIAKKKKRRK